MGCEDYRVLLRAGVDVEDVCAVLLSRPGVSRDGQAKDVGRSRYFVYNEGGHVFEMEVLVGQGASTEISVRFAVCHPLTADEAFVNFVFDLADSLKASVSIREDLPVGLRGDFSWGDQKDSLESSMRTTISAKRSYWVSDFGPEQAAVGCDEAIRRFVLRER